MRAVIYARQSLDKAGEGLAVARQQSECEALCRSRGWDVTEVVADNDVSASTGKVRPGYARILGMIDRRETDIVVVWAVDRLVRRLIDLEDVITRTEGSGVKIATVSGDIDLATDQGRLVGRILASVARGEVERKGARQRAQRVQSATAGKPVRWSHRPFGYRADKVTAEPVEAAAVRTACEQLISGGTLPSIARQWNDAGLVTPQRGGKAWSNRTVRTVLINPRIAGLSTHDGVIVGTGQWDALVPEDLWRAVHATLTDPSRSAPRGAATLLGGRATCLCGAPVYGGRTSHGGRVYRCRDLAGSGGVHVARSATPIDEYVTEIVVNRLSRPDAASLLVDTSKPDDEALREEERTVMARMDQLAGDYAADDTMTAAQFRAMNQAFAARLAKITAARSDAARVSVLGPLVNADDTAKAWAELDVDRQRAVVEALMTVRLGKPGRGARTFDAGTVTIAWA